MPLLELAQQPEQTFEFRSEYHDSVVFDAQLESEELLTLSVYYDEKGNRISADLRIENGDPEPITLEQARGLMPLRALQQQREAAMIQFNDPPGEGPGADDDAEHTGDARRRTFSPQGQSVERVIFPADESSRPEHIRATYLPIERGGGTQGNYFGLEQIRHEIVVGAANYDRSDPDVSRAAANYYAGKADLYNEIRGNLVREDPSLETRLPGEINRDAIITPEIAEERDRRHEQSAQSLAIG